jgi:hypothetical protein
MAKEACDEACDYQERQCVREMRSLKEDSKDDKY